MISLPIGCYPPSGRTPATTSPGAPILGVSIPSFYLATLCRGPTLALVRFRSAARVRVVADSPFGHIAHLASPVVIPRGQGLAGGVMRMTRTMMPEVLRQTTSARPVPTGPGNGRSSSGMPLKNALIPVVTIGLQVGLAVGGTVVTENIFNMPGLGGSSSRVQNRDYPSIQVWSSTSRWSSCRRTSRWTSPTHISTHESGSGRSETMQNQAWTVPSLSPEDLLRSRPPILLDFLGAWQGEATGFAYAVIVIVFALAALFAPLVAPFDPNRIAAGPRLISPAASHFLGTDNLGRDVFSRVIYAGRVSMRVGLFAVLLGTTLSVTIGIVSGYFGGWIDMLFQRLIDAWIAFPAIIFVMVLISVTGPGIWWLTLAIGMQLGVGSSRIIRSATLSVKSMPFVEAAADSRAPHLAQRHSPGDDAREFPKSRSRS
ncbi:ABC transporter permease subunit [Candidatus Amarobacter glycogenicus]|uniref:ABC transporter permease subunit n=1 Tax=Candidatus Amarobacter glycogenicus TaxID=3140699 RepID=UPI002A0FF077|nr:ABC transporter permease subunit [Dehalococcoidia bacterium]